VKAPLVQASFVWPTRTLAHIHYVLDYSHQCECSLTQALVTYFTSPVQTSMQQSVLCHFTHKWQHITCSMQFIYYYL